MKFFSKILDLITYLDFFQQNVSLKLNSQYRISLLSGKLISIGMILFLFYSIMESNTIQKVNPIVLQQNIENFQNPEILLTDQSFRFSFGISDEFQFLESDPSIFTYKVNYVSVKDGGESHSEEKREIKRCEFENYKRFPEIYDNLILNKTFCLKNGSMHLQGYWSDIDLYYMSVKLEKCFNSTQSEIICKSEKEMLEYFGNNSIYFNIFFQQNHFDLANFNRPINSKIKTYDSGIEYGRKKEIKLFLKKTTLFTDYQGIFTHDDIIDTYSFDKVESDTVGSNNTFLEFQIYSSEIRTNLKRRYETLFELVALLGGITKSFTVICTIFIKILYDWNINENIMNSLFLILHKNNQKQSFLKFNRLPTDPIFSKRITSDRQVASDSNELNQTFNQDSDLAGKIESIDESKKSKNPYKFTKNLKFSLFGKIAMFNKKQEKRTEKENLYLDFFRKCDEKLDLIHILRKLEEVDRLKLILLNPKQIKLFNSLSKKCIFIENETIIKQQTNKFSLDLKELEIQKAIRIKTLAEKMKMNKMNGINEIDERLINLINLC